MTNSSNDNDPPEGAKAAGTCPICGKPRDEQYRPFCSKRCADVDLGRWFKGDYAIPVMAEDGETAGQLPPERPDDPEGGGA